jgi:hypothetical protein
MQLGASWFDTVAQELSTEAYSTQAADSFFQQRHDRATAASDAPRWAARAVLADMEPKASVPGRDISTEHMSTNADSHAHTSCHSHWTLHCTEQKHQLSCL